MDHEPITLREVLPCEHAAFKADLQASFAVAVVREFGRALDEPIPSDAVLDEALAAADAVGLHIERAGRAVGGAVLNIDRATHRNELALFFLKVGDEGRGIGSAAWRAIELRFPETVTWRTHTPYFEKRNIHFYVNKCGFRIVQFHNAYNRDPERSMPIDELPDDDAFEFEKVMKEDAFSSRT